MKKQKPETKPKGENNLRSISFPKWLIWAVVAIISVAILASVIRSFWYFEVINNDEVGIAIEAGQIQGVKQPGIAYDLGLFVQLVKIKTSAVAITVDDPELITSDKQRIGLQVTADVFRPHETDKETDKLIFTPDGVFPNLIFNNGGTLPTFDVTNP